VRPSGGVQFNRKNGREKEIKTDKKIKRKQEER
jgi:hypothetical protein